MLMSFLPCGIMAVLDLLIFRLEGFMHVISSSKRNSLIELYRFFFAMNVLICHGYFPVELSHFGPDRISVEFFFILSGFLFYHSLERLREKRTLEAVSLSLKTKLAPLLVPTVIGMISNLILNILSDYRPKLEVFRYLWYIPAMLAVLVVYAILRTLLKSDKLFFGVIACLFVIATALRFSGNDKLFFFDYIRSTSAISLGILVALVPRLKLRQVWLWTLVVPLGALIFYIIYARLAVTVRAYEALLDLILYPLLVYLTFQIDFHFAPFNLLGALSFGIYAFQCPARLVQYLGVPSPWIPFGIIFALSILDCLARALIARRRALAK